MLFGADADSDDVIRWHQQGFHFEIDKRSEHYPWGLVQVHGGPCGVLAPIQGLLLCNLLFEKGLASRSERIPIEATTDECYDALFIVLTKILLRAKMNGPFIWVSSIKVEMGEKYSSGVRTTTLTVVRPQSPTELLRAIASSKDLLTSSVGVISFIYSLILNKTPMKIREEIDVDLEEGLVQRFGHCGQELVNLLITGVATSNVFDGSVTYQYKQENKEDESTTCKGIFKSEQIGYLSLLEAKKFLEVGQYYKNPQYPVWVVGSMSHYTVLFGVEQYISKLSPREAYQQKLEKAFKMCDPENRGFIETKLTGKLLRSLDLHPYTTAEHVNFVANAEEMGGIVLFEKFVEAVTSLVDPPELRFREKESGVFVLYHYNGIRSKDSKCLSRLYCKPNGANVKSNSQGLEDVIRTRWKNAILNLKTPYEPRI